MTYYISPSRSFKRSSASLRRHEDMNKTRKVLVQIENDSFMESPLINKVYITLRGRNFSAVAQIDAEVTDEVFFCDRLIPSGAPIGPS